MQGNSIHAQIYPPLAQEIKPKIKEGSVYNLSCFVVKKSNRQYKPVSNDNMIGLTSWTEIDEVVEIPPAFPVLAYSLTPIEQIHSHVDDTTQVTLRTYRLHASMYSIMTCVAINQIRCYWGDNFYLECYIAAIERATNR